MLRNKRSQATAGTSLATATKSNPCSPEFEKAYMQQRRPSTAKIKKKKKSWLYIWDTSPNGNPLQYSCLENPMDGGAWWAAVHGVTKGRTQLSDFTFTFHFHALEKKMATHSNVRWRIPGMGEPGGLPSMGSHRVGHRLDCSDLAAAPYQIYDLHIISHSVTNAMAPESYSCPSLKWKPIVLI